MQINGRAIRLLREEHGWNQAELAAAVGISGAHLSQVEASLKGLSPRRARKIADHLGVSVADLRPNATEDVA